MPKPLANPFRQCLGCGVTFRLKSSKGKYCTMPCAKKHHRQRHQALAAQRFWAKVDKGGPNGCWLYTGFRKWDGYGWLSRAKPGGHQYLTAHRYAWILTHGEPAAGMHILHSCDNPPCCNPAHLRLGTHQENMLDRVIRGRIGKLHHDRVRPERRKSV